MSNVWFDIETNMEFAKTNPERRAFWNHMQKVIRALRDLELVDSGDLPPNSEITALLDVLYDFHSQDILEGA